MTVFKGYLKIIRRNLTQMFLYLGIFITILMMIEMMLDDTQKGTFQATKLDIAVIDRDGGAAAKGLKTYLSKQHNLVKLPDEKKRLQEELFYRNVSYIVTIPKNFEERCIKGDEKLPTTKVPGSTTAYYADEQIRTFLNEVKVYEKSGYTAGEAVDAALKHSEVKAEVKLDDVSGSGGQMSGHAYLFQFFPYLFIAVLCYSLSAVIVIFREKEVRKRMLCAPISYLKQNLGAIMALLTVTAGFYGICMLLPIGFYGKEFLNDPHLGYLIANSVILLLVALSIAFTIGMCTNNIVALNGIVNVVALGMCFLCGVFVPMSMLGSGVKKVAQFLPVYWYEEINNTLGKFAVLTPDMKNLIYKGFGIQLAIAAACVCIGLVIGKKKQEA